ncbi:LysE family translocator [Brooklawnia propionicigenes]|uniref:LysE family translocator n=1 Tax=Brooklawnia propionicigenes TaxID=3041175 RepID=UPI00257315BF|nr:LysE family translocator [Brooklawnia sp. SH051]
MLHAVTGFALVAAVLTIIPGLDTTLVLRTAIARGRDQAAVTAAGVCAGLLVWGVAAAVGAAALLAASELAYRMISYAGIAYMVYLGSAMIVRSFRSHEEQTQDAAHAPRRESLWQAFVTGAGTNILNPKIGVFYIATMPQFIPAGNSPLGMGLLLAGVHVLLTLAWFTLIITGAYAAKRWLSRPRATRIIDRVAGVVIIGFAGRLALQPR